MAALFEIAPEQRSHAAAEPAGSVKQPLTVHRQFLPICGSGGGRLRIEGQVRVGQVASRGASRTAAGSAFSLSESVGAERAAPTGETAGATGIEALLALQAVEDPVLAKRKALRRGSRMLDVLGEAQADLLAGSVGEGRLHLMMALVTQARERVDPELEALLDDIELRVRVELAKHGRYPQ